MCQPGGCPSAPDGGCGFDCVAAAMQGFGYSMNGRWAPAGDEQAVREVREAEAQTFCEALTLEKQAVAEIESALSDSR